MKTKDILIYAAGKTWTAQDFKTMRNKYGFNIISRWINVQRVLTSPKDTFPDEILYDEDYKREIWDNGCKIDCGACDMGILFTREYDSNMLSGALVELGHITASEMFTGIKKPVYIIGQSESVLPIGYSDRAWKSQSTVHCAHDITNMYVGFKWATKHYKQHYSEDWHKSRCNPFHIELRNLNKNPE